MAVFKTSRKQASIREKNTHINFEILENYHFLNLMYFLTSYKIFEQLKFGLWNEEKFKSTLSGTKRKKYKLLLNLNLF